jgi:hypothetical protein
LQQAFKNWEYHQHEPDELAALRYILVLMVKRQVIKIDAFQELGVNSDKPFNPNNLEQRRAAGRASQGEMNWDFDAGCFD